MLRMLLLVLAVGGAAVPVTAKAALVGTFNAVGDQITTPLAFSKDTFNSAVDVQGGLSFAIAPGLSGPVTLEILAGTKNVAVTAAAIGSGFGISQTLPLTLTSEALQAGIHPFAIGVVASGAPGSAIVSRLTLTPIPGALPLLLTSAAALVGLGAARRGC